MAHQQVHVFRKLIKACMCSVRGFARTVHPFHNPREPPVGISSKTLTFFPFPFFQHPHCLCVPPASRFNLNFAPARPKAALRFFKVMREVISRAVIWHIYSKAFVHVIHCFRHSSNKALFLTIFPLYSYLCLTNVILFYKLCLSMTQ